MAKDKKISSEQGKQLRLIFNLRKTPIKTQLKGQKLKVGLNRSIFKCSSFPFQIESQHFNLKCSDIVEFIFMPNNKQNFDHFQTSKLRVSLPVFAAQFWSLGYDIRFLRDSEGQYQMLNLLIRNSSSILYKNSFINSCVCN